VNLYRYEPDGDGLLRNPNPFSKADWALMLSICCTVNKELSTPGGDDHFHNTSSPT